MRNPLIIALDVADRKKALALVNELKDCVSIFKVGPVLFTRYGPGIINEIKSLGCRIFLDLKFYDIPNSVAQAVKAIAELNVDMFTPTPMVSIKKPLVWGFTVHISGGKEMLEKTVNVLKNIPELKRPKILGVTILTSVAKAEKQEIINLVKIAKEVGLDGVIASSHEIESIRKVAGKDFFIVTPGIRPEGSDIGDQKRVATPKQAISKGADYIVVGRPIIENANPREVAKQILNEVGYKN